MSGNNPDTNKLMVQLKNQSECYVQMQVTLVMCYLRCAKLMRKSLFMAYRLIYNRHRICSMRVNIFRIFQGNVYRYQKKTILNLHTRWHFLRLLRRWQRFRFTWSCHISRKNVSQGFEHLSTLSIRVRRFCRRCLDCRHLLRRLLTIPTTFCRASSTISGTCLIHILRTKIISVEIFSRLVMHKRCVFVETFDSSNIVIWIVAQNVATQSRGCHACDYNIFFRQKIGKSVDHWTASEQSLRFTFTSNRITLFPSLITKNADYIYVQKCITSNIFPTLNTLSHYFSTFSTLSYILTSSFSTFVTLFQLLRLQSAILESVLL